MKKSDMTFSPYQLEFLGDLCHSDFSASRLVQKKGIAHTTSWRRIRIFEDSNPEIPTYTKKNRSPKSSDEFSPITALRLESKCLRVELKDVKMHVHVFDTMIDVAEEMFNLPIRKKTGTKQ